MQFHQKAKGLRPPVWMEQSSLILYPILKKEWKILALDHNVSFDSIEYNSQGTKLLTSGLGSVPKLFDAKTGIAIQLKDFPYLQIIKSRFLPNGEAFVSATESGMLVFTESKHGLVYKKLPA